MLPRTLKRSPSRELLMHAGGRQTGPIVSICEDDPFAAARRAAYLAGRSLADAPTQPLRPKNHETLRTEWTATRQHIRQFAIGVLVTKDSGVAGGTEEELQAAQAEGCQAIVVARPLFAPKLDRIPAFNDFDALVEPLLRNSRPLRRSHD